MNERKLTQEATQFLEKSAKERMYYCNKDQWIGYGAAMGLIDLLEEKFNEPPQIRQEGLLIYGDSTNGKTAILKKFYDMKKSQIDYVDEGNDTIYEIPIIYFQAPSIPDEGRLYSSILHELCVPHNSREKILEKSKLAEHYLSKLKTRMILVDEIHSALTGNLSKQRTFINDLKMLSNRLSLTVILAGTREAHSALAISEETSTRFPSIELPRWSNNKKYSIMA